MTVGKLLQEERRNPDLNMKISAYEELKPYSNSPDYFISFTEIDKMGINPRSKFSTPLGIYAFPLKVAWQEYGIEEKKSFQHIPFAGNRPFIWLLKAKKDPKIIQKIDTSYTESDLKRDEELLKKYTIANKKVINLPRFTHEYLDDLFNRWKGTAKAQEKEWNGSDTQVSPVVYLWRITENLSKLKKGSPSTQWNYLLYRVLGYKGFTDEGRGYIHYRQPSQAVFFTTRAFTVEKKVLNKDYKDTYKEEIT